MRTTWGEDMADANLNENLDIVAQSGLEIQMLDGDLNIIQKLDDEPNDVGGMTSAELKETFDKAGNIIKEYINGTLIPAILADDATEAAREAAEAQRAENETARQTAENTRDAAEQAREIAEESRATAENQRTVEESARATAEQARAAAEQARADETAGIVAQATAQAKAAAASQDAAASSADSAGGSAAVASAASAAAQAAADTASSAASGAEQSQIAAASSAEEARSWAVGGTGTREGEDANNAKYWSQQAQAAAGGGVASFNGRTGIVMPASGDYSAELVGARPNTWLPTVEDIGAAPVNHSHTLDDLGAAAASHNHAANDIASGILGVARGGTGKGSFAANRLIYPSGITTIDQLAFPAVDGSVLRQGVSGAPYWTSLEDLADAMGLSGGAKIQTGSYIGTGTYGSANPCSLTFDFLPQFLAIAFYSSNSTSCGFLVGNGGMGSQSLNSSSTGYTFAPLATSFANSRVSWYSKASAEYQQNGSGKTYYYVAIG